MVDVVRQGTKRLVTCGKCGSELRWGDSDVHLTHRPINVGPYEIECMPEAEDHYQATITCPECRNVITVNTDRSLKRQKIEDQRRSDHNL